MIFPTTQYQLVYADPPWSFRCWSAKGTGRNAEQHYPTMDKKAIQDLPVPSIMVENSVLLLWATFPTLPEALELMQHWGITYKTVAFTWIKTNKRKDTPKMGLGYYTRANAEICLIGTKGKGLPRFSKGVAQVVETNEDPGEEEVLYSKIRAHSRKPDEVRTRIEQLFGDVKRIELFARTKSPGWDAWGNQVECFPEVLPNQHIQW